MSQQLSITRALAELKLLDARISKKISETVFVDAKKNNAEYTLINQIKADQVSEGNYTSITDLINRRQAIKTAIIQSNANTTVNVNGVQMTVASAIEMKKSVEYKKALLQHIRLHLNRARAMVEKANSEMEISLEKQAPAILGKAANDTTEQYKNFAEMYRKSNTTSLVDNMKIEEKIKTLENDVSGFESECDFTLSESNAKTMIEV